MIIDALQSLAVPLSDLKPMPGNPRRGDVAAVKRSYERFGQRKPIVAKRDGTVIAGNHQLMAAQQLKWPKIAVVFVDDDDMTAKAFALADNRIGDLGTYDEQSLAQLLEEVASDESLLDATGYSQHDLDLLLETDDAAPPILDEFKVIDPVSLETEYRCPSCSFEWSGSPRPGQALHEPDDE